MKFLLFRISYIRGEYEGTPTINLKLRDTEHKLNVHKTVRRELGRLMHVLCTFNLSRVFKKKNHIPLYSAEKLQEHYILKPFSRCMTLHT